uniref:Uncharacterized protein n=1 Tax=viral metagenome TaxID=1070528 RepID=A0A6M3KZL8_9ZZZZ
MSNGVIIFNKCFFCEKEGIPSSYYDMFPEKEVIAGTIGNKFICVSCTIDIYGLMQSASEIEDEILEEESQQGGE